MRVSPILEKFDFLNQALAFGPVSVAKGLEGLFPQVLGLSECGKNIVGVLGQGIREESAVAVEKEAFMVQAEINNLSVFINGYGEIVCCNTGRRYRARTLTHAAHNSNPPGK